MDRKYSTAETYNNSINSDDAPDGSDGGYTRHGSYITPEAMKELVMLRERLALMTINWQASCDQICDLEAERAKLREALIAVSEDDEHGPGLCITKHTLDLIHATLEDNQ